MIKEDIVLIAVQLACCVILFFVAGIAEKLISGKWRLCYVLPVLVCIVLTAHTGVEKSLIGVYIGSALLVVGLLRPKKNTQRIASVASALLTLSGFVISAINPAYRSVNYLKDFEYGFAQMKEHYILAEHKGIDWDGLYEKYRQDFEEAVLFNDKELNLLAWLKLTSEFYDGHTSFVPNDDELIEKCLQNYGGNDYGLVLLSYTDGRTVAVNVDESLNEIGIHNGTVVTLWNDMLPEEANKLSEGYELITYADVDNAYFYRTIWASGTGNDCARVTFIDDNGNEKTAELTIISNNYYDRLSEAIEILNQGVKSANISWSKVNDTTACLRIKMMMFDAMSEYNNNYTGMQSEIREGFLELKQQGVKNIVIDIRGNGGGSGNLIMAVAQLFAPEGEHYYCNDGVWNSNRHYYEKNDDGTFKVGERHTFMGENLLGDGHIVLLVNSGSASASDHLTKVMNSMENVTVMGFTEPCGSAQGVSQIDIESGIINISASLMLDENGNIFIDSGADGQSGNTLDIQVALDEEAVKSLYDDGEDYLMRKAEELLAEK